MATNSTDALVVLRGGVSVAAPAYVLVLDFEARGIHISRDGDVLTVGPSYLLTDHDRAVIRAYKPDLLRLLVYCTRTDLDAHLFGDQHPAARQERVYA